MAAFMARLPLQCAAASRIADTPLPSAPSAAHHFMGSLYTRHVLCTPPCSSTSQYGYTADI